MGKLIKCLTVIFILAAALQSKAQLNPMSSIYFQNQYLANPAMAGMEEGLTLNAGYRKQWSSIPGSPQTQAFTGEYGFSNRVGMGLLINNDKAGLIRRTNVMGTYAYHLPLGDAGQRLNFGLSLGVKTERINLMDVNGDNGDVLVGQFNQRETNVDGDFGLAYTSGGLTLQAALPNMKTYFKTDVAYHTVDRSVFYSAASYKFYSGQSMDAVEIEPKLAFRGVKGHTNIVDAGANVAIIEGALNFMGMWHSSKSVTFGIGMDYRNSLTITGMYTTDTGDLRGYSNGDFEIGIKLKVF